MAEDGAYDAYEDWQLVGDAYYSRRELYALDWGGGGGGGSGAMNLAFMRCVAACCSCWVHLCGSWLVCMPACLR